MEFTCSLDLPDGLLQVGGVNSLVGTLTSRTLMYAELDALLSIDARGDLETYRRLTVEENVCGKNSSATRQKTFRHLRELYALDKGVPLFEVWLRLWSASTDERPLLALLLASTREPLLRATAAAIVNTLPGAPVASQDFEKSVDAALPEHYCTSTRARLGRNCASAWEQSGHLAGKLHKRRAKAVSGPATTAFALLLGYLSGARGLALFDSLWVQLLDSSDAQVDQLAFAANTRGWIDYRRIENVVDISFSMWKPLIAKT